MNVNRRYGAIVSAVILTCGLACSPMHVESGEEFFSLIVMPDTQNYTDSSFDGRPEYFHEQTRWIRDSRDSLNTVMVAHAGDIIQSSGTSRAEWQIADRAFKTIDDAVPYILCLGNHDIRISGKGAVAENDRRETLVNEYFPPSRFTENPLYGSNFGPDKNAHFREKGRCDNYFLFFEGGGMEFLIMALEFKPRDEVIEWANGVAARHPEKRCIVVTHGYLGAEAERITMSNYRLTGNSGQEMWDKLIARHGNMFMVLCGHVMGESVLTSTGMNGSPVHQVLADFQNIYVGGGGSGYLRIMKFYPAEDRIDVETYSPVLERRRMLPVSRFSLEYRMQGRRAMTGS